MSKNATEITHEANYTVGNGKCASHNPLKSETLLICLRTENEVVCGYRILMKGVSD